MYIHFIDCIYVSVHSTHTCKYLCTCTYMVIRVHKIMNMYIHVCTMFRHLYTVLPYPVQGGRIPDENNMQNMHIPFFGHGIQNLNLQNNMQNIKKNMERICRICKIICEVNFRSSGIVNRITGIGYLVRTNLELVRTSTYLVQTGIGNV